MARSCAAIPLYGVEKKSHDAGKSKFPQEKKEHPVRCRIIVNLLKNIALKSLRLNPLICLVSPKESGKSRCWTQVRTQRFGRHHFDGGTRMKTNTMHGFLVTRR
jgi:hypothetical protein